MILDQQEEGALGLLKDEVDTIGSNLLELGVSNLGESELVFAFDLLTGNLNEMETEFTSYEVLTLIVPGHLNKVVDIVDGSLFIPGSNTCVISCIYYSQTI